jgi:hypothetical protein
MWAIKYYLTTNRINIKTRIDLKRESLQLSFKPKNIKIECYLSKTFVGWKMGYYNIFFEAIPNFKIC